MLIGVLSDTHGRADMAQAAADMLKSSGAQLLIHCGDVGSPQVLDAISILPACFVLGNTDEDEHTLRHHAQRIGVQFFGVLGRKEVDGSVISFLHGDDSHTMRHLLESQDCDFLFHGHTHIADLRDVGRIRIVNPGALQRASVKTVALVDTATRDVESLKVS